MPLTSFPLGLICGSFKRYNNSNDLLHLMRGSLEESSPEIAGSKNTYIYICMYIVYIYIDDTYDIYYIYLIVEHVTCF